MKENVRMKEMRGMINKFLESAVQMRERLSRRAKAHSLAKVITTFVTIVAI